MSKVSAKSETSGPESGMSGYKTSLEHLLEELHRIDLLIGLQVHKFRMADQGAIDEFRGLCIRDEEIDAILAGKDVIGAKQENELYRLQVLLDQLAVLEARISDKKAASVQAGTELRLERLKDLFQLSPLDIDALLICLAPELDLKYEKLYAYLQDDVTKKRPSVDLVLNVLCTSADEKLARRVHFASNGPLVRHALLHLISDPNRIEPSLLSHYLKLDDQVVSFLLGEDSLDHRLASFCETVDPIVSIEDLALNDHAKQALPTLVGQAWETRKSLRLYFYGPHGAGKRRAAEALANEVGARLLAADLARAPNARTESDQALKLLFREARFKDSILFLDGLEGFPSHDRINKYDRFQAALATHAGITILAGVKPWVSSGSNPTNVISVHFPIPDFTQRRGCWQADLKAAGITLKGQRLDSLAGCFRLTPGQIGEAVAAACNYARWRAAAKFATHSQLRTKGNPSHHDLFAAARAQTGHELATLARQVEPTYTWNDIVLPEDTIAQLRELCQWVTQRHRVLGEWGFDRKLSLGKGVTALFAGPSGTGKTMAAEIIANDLGLDLYKIDLAGVVSKYIGETEKNLDRIFTAAENSNTILFFDEADALFGKRSEVRDSHDRYANIEISFLLQKMEEYDGIAILATNLRQNLDESFVRRLAFTVHFPFPDDASRRRIWSGIWPTEIPLGHDLDLDFLAHQFKLSGGNIKNIALAAAFLAAQDGGSVTMTHLLHATRREYQKMGKILSEEELNGRQADSQPGVRSLQ